MSAAGKRAMFVRIGVILGLLAYLGLLVIAGLSIAKSHGHVWQSQSDRFPGFLSDTGMLLMLAIVAPFVLIAAFKFWRDPNRG
jgi:hypothetical protein